MASLSKAQHFSITTVLILFFLAGGKMGLVAAGKSWCVANPSTSDIALRDVVAYICAEIDCTPVRTGPCFDPNNIISDASVALNLYYQAHGENESNCRFPSVSLIAVTNPSYGDCQYA